METWTRGRFAPYAHALDFVGAITRGALAGERSRCDVVVLPSRWESFGLVCPEAMAAGRVVIGSRAGGMAEIIEEGKSGLLVSPRNPRDIAEKIRSLSGTPARVTELGLAGRERVRTLLAPARVVDAQLASYRRAIERARGRCEV